MVDKGGKTGEKVTQGQQLGAMRGLLPSARSLN